MRRVMVAMVMLSCGLSTAAAQERKATEKETAAITECYNAKLDSPEGIEGCLFKLVAEPCVDASDGSTVATADCYRVEQSIWDRLLNAAHRELRGDLDGAQKKALQKMQRVWIASRDATCSFYADKIRGSLAVPLSAACYARETARRALILKQFAGL